MQRLPIFIAILCLNISVLKSQNLQYEDYKTLHFGYTIGLDAMDYGIRQKSVSIEGKTYDIAVSKLQLGFVVGIIGEIRLNRYFSLRTTPSLHIGSREITFQSTDLSNPKEYTANQSIPIVVPFYIKYCAEREFNHRPYLVLGGGFHYDLGVDRTKPILLKPWTYFVEFGAGCDLYFQFFKLSPEIKFSIGLNDVLESIDNRPSDAIKDNEKKYTYLISKLSSKILTLSFNFE